MNVHWTRRAIMGAAVSAVVGTGLVSAQEKPAALPKPAPNAVPATAAASPTTTAPPATAAPTASAAKGKLTHESLGTMLKAMGLETQSSEQHYNFALKSTVEEAEWIFQMTAVLSQDGSSIWIMAWLDELPKSAGDVPRTALLQLLSDNDKLGKGQFFAYMAKTRRFVLQRVIPNENITSVGFNAALQDLGQSVAIYQSHWSVANWTSSTGEDPAAAARSAFQPQGSAPQSPKGTPATSGPAPQALPPTTSQTPPPAAAPTKPVQSVVNDSKFNPTGKR